MLFLLLVLLLKRAFPFLHIGIYSLHSSNLSPRKSRPNLEINGIVITCLVLDDRDDYSAFIQ